jgi:hypothetical protein
MPGQGVPASDHPSCFKTTTHSTRAPGFKQSAKATARQQDAPNRLARGQNAAARAEASPDILTHKFTEAWQPLLDVAVLLDPAVPIRKILRSLLIRIPPQLKMARILQTPDSNLTHARKRKISND